VKLLRFELASSPGYTRSGIFYSGKVYETDGANAVGVHEWADVVPFIPTGLPPSYRVFSSAALGDLWGVDEDSRPFHHYLNPATLLAPSRAFPKPLLIGELGYEPQLAVIIGSAGSQISVEEADGFILGVTVLNTLVAREIDAAERRQGAAVGRSRDFATAAGPFITTPEELDDIVVDDSRGRRYKLEAVIRVNGEEVAREDLTDLPFTFAELISFASETCSLAPGDLIGLGPLGLKDNRKPILDTGDEVQVFVERLGALVTRIA
jgi:fumarylacetoacetate (FAA) hydrolase